MVRTVCTFTVLIALSRVGQAVTILVRAFGFFTVAFDLLARYLNLFNLFYFPFLCISAVNAPTLLIARFSRFKALAVFLNASSLSTNTTIIISFLQIIRFGRRLLQIDSLWLLSILSWTGCNDRLCVRIELNGHTLLEGWITLIAGVLSHQWVILHCYVLVVICWHTHLLAELACLLVGLGLVDILLVWILISLDLLGELERVLVAIIVGKVIWKHSKFLYK